MLTQYDPIDLAVRAYAALREENPQPIINQNTVIFAIHTDRVYMMLPEGKDILIGRNHRSNIMQPDLDLALYEAEDAGMSRLHAALKHERNGWWLIDMDSSNGTWVNGERLAPFVPCLLDKSCHVFLGKLEIAIMLPESRRTNLVA
jgi:hypothetical protein